MSRRPKARKGPVVRLPVWTPGWESEQEYLKTAQMAFLAEAGRYISKVKDTAEREQPMAEPDRGHLEWLAEFQVLGRTYSHVAKRHGEVRKTVHRNVGRVAIFVAGNDWLREGKRGRPPSI